MKTTEVMVGSFIFFGNFQEALEAMKHSVMNETVYIKKCFRDKYSYFHTKLLLVLFMRANGYFQNGVIQRKVLPRPSLS